MTKDLLGQTLAGRYHFEGNIGEGTFAKVYRVHDTRRSVDLAAKVLRTDIAHDSNFAQRFRREADVLARLQHPNIVRYYDLVEADDYVFILMEYVPGQTLQSTLYRLGQALSARETIEFLRPLSAALHFAHGEGVIHRDLKPANVLMHENGNLLVTDFGIARILDDAAMSLTGGRVLGTPLYMAPEQISGESATPATDIYALGVILYQMLTGKVPFDGTHPEAQGDTTSERVTYEHLNIPPRPLAEFSSKLDESVEIIVLQCLAKDPTKRPRTVRDVYDLMAEAVGKVPADFNDLLSDSAVAPPNLKLPEVSQFEMAIKQVDSTPIEKPALPDVSDYEKTVLPPSAKDTQEAVPVLAGDNPAVTIKSAPYTPTPIPEPVVSAPIAYQNAPQPMPVYQQPAYGETFEEEGLGFDPMRFLLIGVALAMLACIALVIYAIDPFGSDDTNDPLPSPTAANNDTGGNPTATFLPTPEDGGDPVINLTTAPSNSSNGDRIAFASRREGGVLQIFTMNTDGTDVQRVSQRSDIEHLGPAWSPDGSKIAFYGSVGEELNPADIYVMDADGANLTNITNSPDYNDRYVAWSPDGRFLLFHSDQPGQDGSRDYEIYRFDLLTSEQVQLTQNGAYDYGPDWSPDGTQIAFFSYVNNRGYIFTMTPDGENRTQLDPAGIENGAAYPSWSPDGTQIVFHVQMSPGIYQIYVMDAEGQTARPLMDTYVNDQFPDWSPDGEHIIFQRVDTDQDRQVYRYTFADGSLTPLGPKGGYQPDWKPIY